MDGPNTVAALGASRSRKHDAWRSFSLVTLEAQQFPALALPVEFEQGWHSQNDDIQETAEDQAKNKHPCKKQGCGFVQQCSWIEIGEWGQVAQKLQVFIQARYDREKVGAQEHRYRHGPSPLILLH